MSDNSLQPGNEDEWVIVAYAMGLTEANIVAGLLSANKIPVLIQQESAARALGLTVGLGAISILVPTRFEGEALSLLEGNDDYPSQLDGPSIVFPEEG